MASGAQKVLVRPRRSVSAPEGGLVRFLWRAALWLIPASLWAAPTISYVQGNYATPQTPQISVTVAYSSAQNAGDLNVVVVGWNNSTSTVSAVTDAKGNAYSIAAGPTIVSGVASQSIFYAKSIAAGANAVTVTFTAPARFPNVRILEYRGGDPSQAVDINAAGTGTGSNCSSGFASTRNAADLLFGANYSQNPATRAGFGFTRRLLTSQEGGIAEDRMVNSRGSYSATAPLSASGWWVMQMVAFRADSTPPTAPANLVANAVSAGQINLNWTSSTDNSGVTAYRVERCSGTGCTGFAQIASVSGTTYSNTGLTAGTTYSYRVRASDAATNASGYSNVASATATAQALQFPVITSANTANATVGAAFSYQISATNSPTSYGATGLPPGLGVNTATGSISGTPTSSGTSTVTLSATNSAGTGTATLTITTTASSDTTPPAVPTGLTPSPVSSSRINLSWSASTDPDNAPGQLSYGVYRDGARIATTAAGTTAWNDTGLAASTTYTYAVSAQDPAGNSSAQSVGVRATTSDSATRPYSTTFPLTENPISEGGNWINGTSASTSWASVRTTTSFAFGNSTVGTYGDATALVTGSWGPEQTVQATVHIVSPPTSGDAEVELRLRSAISPNSINGYEILCSVNPNSVYLQIVKWMGPINSFSYVQQGGSTLCREGDVLKATITTTTSGGTTSAVIKAYVNDVLTLTGTDTNVGGTGPYLSGSPGVGFYNHGGSDPTMYGFSSFTASDGSTADTTAPSVPTNLSAAAVSSTQIDLGWTASTDNVGVSSYQVFRNNVPIATTKTATYSDTGLSPSTQYTYTVAAADAAGNTSSQSAPVSVTTPALDITPPSVPGNLQSSNVTASSLTITWSASTDDVAVAGYRVFRNGSQVATTTATSYADSGLASQTTYAYTVAAFDYSNNVSAQSQPLSVTTSAGAPTPPSFVQVKQNQVTNGTAVSAVFSGATHAGSTIVAYVIWDNTGSVIVTDSLGDHFVSVSAPTIWSGGYSAQVFYATNILGGADTVTATFRNSVSSFGIVYAHEYAGISVANPVDVTVAASGSSSSLSSGIATTTSANDLIFGAGVSDNAVTAAGSGFTARDMAYGNITEDRTASSTGSYSATATHNGSSWAMQMVAFRAAQ